MIAPLRILHFNSLLKGGGTDDQCVKLVARLQEAGHQVWIVGPDGREFSRIIRQLQIPFVPVHREGPLKWKLVWQAAQILRQERIQIIHGHHGRDIWPTILAARLSRTRPKVVLTRHLAKSPASWGTRRFMLGQCDALVAVSEFTARVLREGVYEPDSPELERRARPPIFGDHRKIRVIHGGIDTGRFVPRDGSGLRSEWGLAPEHFAFGVVGSYDFPRGKGQREFLQAAARIQQRVPAARFLIVGRGSMAEVLRADIEQLGLRGRAWLPPYCYDMPAAMNALDCLVHPQVGTEAFPGVVLEAFACGRPVIASALDGIPEAFAAGGVGRLVTPEDVPELAAAMADQVNQPPLDSELRKRLHERISSQFSVAAAGRKITALYGEILKPAQDSESPAVAAAR